MKKLRGKISAKRIFLRFLSADDVTKEYLHWMQDKEVTQFLESRWTKHTLTSIRQYVRQAYSNPSDFLFGIFLKEDGKHIGNIKIGGVNKRHKFADVGLLIGDKKEWGKGYGTEAIKSATRYAFKKLKLNKLMAGIYANNTGSYKAFIKAGYREIGRLKDHRLAKRKYVDEILVEKCGD